jgi:hypothetical protein
MNTYSPEKRRELETDARAVVTRGGSATKPTIYVNLQGGAIHDIRATKGLEDVTIVFSGDDQDCDPENLVTLNPELPDFIYAVAKPNGNISAALAKFLHKQASLYNAKR